VSSGERVLINLLAFGVSGRILSCFVPPSKLLPRLLSILAKKAKIALKCPSE